VNSAASPRSSPCRRAISRRYDETSQDCRRLWRSRPPGPCPKSLKHRLASATASSHPEPAAARDAAATRIIQGFDAVLAELAAVPRAGPLIEDATCLRDRFKALYGRAVNQMLQFRSLRYRALLDGLFDAIAQLSAQ
jgi:hypothetical protein